MSGKLRAYLELVRVANVFTAAADIIAGFLYTGGDPGDWRTLLLLAGGSSCLYAGGVALNDACDAERDARERAHRPVPSGRVSRREAIVLSIVLLAAGGGLAAGASRRAAVITFVLVVAIVLYDVAVKTTRLAPGMMGVCRALNISLGMSGTPVLLSAETLIPIGSMWLYVTSLTHFARREVRPSGGGGKNLIAGAIGVELALGGLACLYVVMRAVHGGFLAPVLLMGLYLGYRGFAAAANPTAARVQSAVVAFVVSLVFFDACLAWAGRGPAAGLAVAATCVPTGLLARWFPMT